MVLTRKFLRRVCSSHRIHSAAQILQISAHKRFFPVPSSSQSRAWLPSLVLAAEASSANSFEEVVVVVAAAAGVAGVAAVELEEAVVEVAAGAGAGVAAGVAADVAADVGVAAVGGRRDGGDATEEDTTADVGEEGEEGVRYAEDTEDTVPAEALEGILGEEGVACALHKAAEVVEHEVVAHREAATGEVPSKGSVPHWAAVGRVDIEGAAAAERH